MIRVGLIFENRRIHTVPGESVIVCGNLPELNSWTPSREDTAEHLEMRTGPRMYPRWSSARPVWIEIPVDRSKEMFVVEYKYVRDRHIVARAGQSCFQWESGIRNRTASVPREDGSIWIVSDGSWDSASLKSTVKRTSAPEVLSRWSSLDAEWAALMTPRRHGMEPAFFNMTPHGSAEVPVEEVSGTCPMEDLTRAFPIENEFNALSPYHAEDGCFKVKGTAHGSKLPCFFPQVEVATDSSDELLRDALEKIEELTMENDILRQRCRELELMTKLNLKTVTKPPLEKVLTPKGTPRHSLPARLGGASKVRPASTRSLQEPDVEPQVDADVDVVELW